MNEKTCVSCMDWLDACNAECCKTLSFIIPHMTDDLFKEPVIELLLERPLTKDLVHYYTLRGVGVTSPSILNIETRFLHKDTKQKDAFIFKRDCNALLNNKCTLHGTEEKPMFCREFPTHGVDPSDVHLTPHCLYQIKIQKKVQ